MAAFRFRLETVARLREAVRDERRYQLAEAVRAEQSIQAQLSALLGEANEVRREAAPSLGALSLGRFLESHRYARTLELEQRQLEQQQASVAAEVEARREALTVAEQELRLLEKLREKQAETWRVETERRAA
ncbi:MAG TPA: flagellar export protein FliJ [Pirellulales bacterium]|jgi:flagellar export protein FliJ|nr:flagellar export protein FliJ [Pirellulales bacterium]